MSFQHAFFNQLGAGYQNRTGDWTLARFYFTPKLILQFFTYYAARRLLNLSAAYDAANASGFTNGITLHVPLM